ncbi:DUF2828 family protein [uncultured Clostridium sp.]|uniref:DUF2828 family protein n=1 Tax=uncultured Clostridium sp. TaxID=59620 RepID=UPI002629C637|nr:DUF2828 family protein [uncultured Clostridium sp.]
MKFIEALEKVMNTSTTENGAEGYKTTGKALVDFNFKLPSYRNKRNTNNLTLDFAKVWNEDKELAIKYLFYMRDVRQGIGERDTFRTCLKELAATGELDSRVFDWIEEYGRLDDLFVFFDTNLESDMVKWVQARLVEDGAKLLSNKPCSLLAKWMPSINTSSAETKALAKKFIEAFGTTKKDYRKTLAKLREHIKVLEKTLCQGDWSTIDYSAVPSNANLKYKDAFLKHDTDRRKAYLESLKNGETKINASVTFPHDIVHKYVTKADWYTYNDGIKSYDEALEQMWKALPDYIQGQSSVMVVRDGSGSMFSSVGNTNVTAMDVADALSIYFSERSSGAYKNKFITFSEHPTFVDLSKLSTLHDKLKELHKHDECENTNIEGTFDLILDLAVKNHLKQEDIPSLLIISDMEFDDCVTSNMVDNRDYLWGSSHKKADKKLFDAITEKFNKAGYQLPRVAFWNVNSRTNTIPLTKNKLGVSLVSGFSAAIAKMVLSNELDPYKALVKEITSKRYEQVTLKK